MAETQPRDGDEATPERRAELESALHKVRDRIRRATAAAGRNDEPRLIVVTKFFPVSDLIALADLGVTDIGENREQELTSKVAYLREHRPDLLSTVTRHFIGQIQSKKTRHIAESADVVHTIDRLKVLEKLTSVAAEREHPVDVLVQVDLDGSDAGRGGAPIAELPALTDAAASAETVRLRGLMAVAPLGMEPAKAYERLAQVRDSFVRNHPDATWLSAGMSGDLEEAVAIGATHLRVGSAILGSRPRPM